MNSAAGEDETVFGLVTGFHQDSEDIEVEDVTDASSDCAVNYPIC